jgi:hypothetical protein
MSQEIRWTSDIAIDISIAIAITIAINTPTPSTPHHDGRYLLSPVACHIFPSFRNIRPPTPASQQRVSRRLLSCVLLQRRQVLSCITHLQLLQPIQLPLCFFDRCRGRVPITRSGFIARQPIAVVRW